VFSKIILGCEQRLLCCFTDSIIVDADKLHNLIAITKMHSDPSSEQYVKAFGALRKMRHSMIQGASALTINPDRILGLRLAFDDILKKMLPYGDAVTSHLGCLHDPIWTQLMKKYRARILLEMKTFSATFTGPSISANDARTNAIGQNAFTKLQLLFHLDELENSAWAHLPLGCIYLIKILAKNLTEIRYAIQEVCYNFYYYTSFVV
jgi:hypothetical protein